MESLMPFERFCSSLDFTGPWRPHVRGVSNVKEQIRVVLESPHSFPRFMRATSDSGPDEPMTCADEPTTSRDVQRKEWIALLGRRDMPTDGVEDYCTFLGRALAQRGAEAGSGARRLVRPGLDTCALEVVARKRGVARKLGFGPIHGHGLVAPGISDWSSRRAGDSAAARLPVRDGISRIHAPERAARAGSTGCAAIASNG